MSDALRAVRQGLRAVRKEMKDRGIKRTSCFNGGLDEQTYKFNAKMFELETRLKSLLLDTK